MSEKINVKEIIGLAMLVLDTGIRVANELKKIEGIDPEDKKAIDAKARQLRDSVTPLTNADIAPVNTALPAGVSLHSYQDKLSKLLEEEKIESKEYIANMGVYRKAVKEHAERKDISGLTDSLDRTLKRYE